MRLLQEQAAVSVCVHGESVALAVGARDDLFGDHGLHMGLNIPLEGTCTVNGVIAAIDHGSLGRIGDLQTEPFLRQTAAQRRTLSTGKALNSGFF